MNKYTIDLEMDERTYRSLKKAEVKLKFKGSAKCLFVPFSKRHIKYAIGKYMSAEVNEKAKDMQ